MTHLQTSNLVGYRTSVSSLYYAIVHDYLTTGDVFQEGGGSAVPDGGGGHMQGRPGSQYSH